MLTGRLPATGGLARLGSGVVVGILRQDRASVGDEPIAGASLLEAVMAATGLKAQEARSLLAKFDLTAEPAARAEAALSPGSAPGRRWPSSWPGAPTSSSRRADQPPRPRGDRALERALDDFDGTLLVVTHDRRLLASLHLTRRFDVAAGTVREVEPVSR